MRRGRRDAIDAVRTALRRFAGDQTAATSIEYGLIVALIFLAIVGAIKGYVEATSEMYSDISSTLDE